MNLLAQFGDVFAENPQGFATIIDIKNDGRLIAETPNGATVLLIGTVAVGKNVFYDRLTSKVLGEAPDVEFVEYGV